MALGPADSSPRAIEEEHKCGRGHLLSAQTMLGRSRCQAVLTVQVLSEYFKELEEESIRDNFVIIYELLDEMMDFGFPQTTESKILQE